MADHVNPMVSSASGLPSVLLAAAAPRSAPDKPRPVKIADSQPKEPGSRPTAISADTPQTAMEQLNGYLQEAGSELQFRVDPGTDRTFFRLVSASTGEVLLQVPSEEMLAMARSLRALDKQMGASGVLMNKEG
jgi:flagellar protein FlaG